MKRNSSIMLSILIIILFMLALTNPSQDKHTDSIKKALRSHISEQGIMGNIAASLEITDIAIDLKSFSYSNYILFSVMRHRDSVVSIGILGNVIVIKN